ncbi:MAG: putative phosphoribosyl transferase [Chlamydiales bacterium]|nr:putative phosphoribosyl transferase [Chlamydiales bacterium]
MIEKKALPSHEIEIPIGSVKLSGYLCVPPDARGIVLFAHGSGSSRLSPRNQFVAHFLEDHSLATLLFDLLTPEEEATDAVSRELRFNIPFLAERLLGATDWVEKNPDTHHLSIGYFGASTGAAAALIAAAELGPKLSAVVSRGGRPDLAGHVLSHIQCPTLLIVGGNDFGVIELNQHAMDLLQCKKKLETVPNATHLFEEPGTLEEVGRMASIWFIDNL